MAKICTKCNFENTDADVICQGCGAELAAPVKKKKPKVKQPQDPAIRRILCVVLIAATLLSFFTFVQYIIGSQPLLQTAKEGSTTILFSSNWKVWGGFFKSIGEFFKSLIHFDFSGTDSLYFLFRIVSHVCSCLIYLILTALLGFTAYLVHTKSQNAKLFTIISGASGLVVIVLGFLLGYFLVVNKMSDVHYIRALPQLTVLVLLPLYAQLPLLGLMLPQKEKKEKKDN